MERIIHDSIMEMEMLHLQAEVETIEMERVLAMSLALEEEKLCLLQTELEEYERREGQRSNDSAPSKVRFLLYNTCIRVLFSTYVRSLHMNYCLLLYVGG
jgi:hypothetical protein